MARQGSSQDEGQQAKSSSDEYQAMLLAINDLESAFGGQHTEHDAAAKQRVRQGLQLIARLVEEHCELAEQPGGLVLEAELKLGRSDEVTHVLHVHEQLAHEAAHLLAAIDEPRGDWTGSQVQRQAHDLIKALRSHMVLQGDMLIEQYNRDLGGESGEA